jgi:hypothetical protein
MGPQNNQSKIPYPEVIPTYHWHKIVKEYPGNRSENNLQTD